MSHKLVKAIKSCSTWEVGVKAFIALISAAPLLTQVLEACLQVEVVPENCSILSNSGTVAAGNDLVLHIIQHLLHFDLQWQQAAA